MKKVYIDTMGCQMNKSDTERMLGMLFALGYEEVEEVKKAQDADLYMVNTCSIRQLSEDKAYSRIGLWGKWKKERPEIKIAFCGCVAQQQGEKLLKRFPYVNLVMGTHDIFALPDYMKRIEKGERVCACGETPIPERDIELKRARSVNAWINITEGCDNFCTYCIVPYTRGRERSRSPEIIIKEAKDALAQGFKEITLLGQNVDSYGKNCDKSWTLANLLRDLNNLEGNFRIRFTTSYPADITDDLIEAVLDCDKVCEYFHLPMQSGSTRILKKMNRRYTREEYSVLVAKIRKKIEDATITSDFIAGFPGETEEDFEETLSAMREFEHDYANIAMYSPREMTIAARWEELFLSDEVKHDRFDRLNEQVRINCLKSNEKFLGQEMEVLVEKFENRKGKNIISGRTRNNKMVHIPCEKDLTGEFINVKITGVKTWYLKGEIEDKK